MRRENIASSAPTTWPYYTLTASAAASLLLWLALPPVNLWPLAWLAPIPWVMLIRLERPPGWRPYLTLWLTGFGFWLVALYWLTLPHWATAFGWLALAFYLAVYWPLFVGLSRVAVHGLKISPIVAAPVVWTGLELVRGHVFGGFLMAALGHTQYRWISLVQISDLAGAYGVGFLIVAVAACLARMLPCEGRSAAWWPILPAGAAIALVLGYGHMRLSGEHSLPGPKVALIQGSIDATMKSDPGQNQRVYDQYFELSQQAVARHRDLDLVVWPETMFRSSWCTFTPDYRPPADATWTPAQLETASRAAVQNSVLSLKVPMLLGVDTHHHTLKKVERYNSALFVNAGGEPLGAYSKMHLVMFGEYVPLAEYFPWLYRLTPLPSGLDAGKAPAAVQVGKVRYAPNICFESTIPHLIRGQVVALRREGKEPDVLVNLTNDGWFWGSAELDMHLVCGVFRAIECRKPFLIAANTGISAVIDADGRIVQQGPRRKTDIVVSDSPLDTRGSWYLDHGDVPAGICLAACVGLAVVGLWNRRK